MPTQAQLIQSAEPASIGELVFGVVPERHQSLIVIGANILSVITGSLDKLEIGLFGEAGIIEDYESPSDTEGHCLQRIMIKSSDVHADGYPTVEAVKYMGELLNKWTNGRISMQVFGAMQLGGEKEALEQFQVGALEMTRVSVGVVGPIIPEFNAFNLTYVFRSAQHMS